MRKRLARIAENVVRTAAPNSVDAHVISLDEKTLVVQWTFNFRKVLYLSQKGRGDNVIGEVGRSLKDVRARAGKIAGKLPVGKPNVLEDDALMYGDGRGMVMKIAAIFRWTGPLPSEDEIRKAVK